MLSTALAALLLALIVAIVTWAVVSGHSMTSFDVPLMNWAVEHRHGWLDTVFTVISTLGGSVAMWVLALIACGWYAAHRRWPEFAVVVIAGVGTLLLVRVLKYVVDRDRPPLAIRLVTVENQSFPSGHSLGSIGVIGILVGVFVLGEARRSSRAALVTVAVVFVALVGVSRVYLGVHWPTDVLGGWAIGAWWVLLCRTGYLRFRSRGDRLGGAADRRVSSAPID
ncbi:phosphatase PAP2 family protein [Nocardia callitridis]|uniref:Phosphatidic acid phosphatase type 2/haloperoxidase domain-containing protein n=1 Tax=Nocardia callitridis TaxID=648753 RepID=A0ABP9KL36_9NOCA